MGYLYLFRAYRLSTRPASETGGRVVVGNEGGQGGRGKGGRGVGTRGEREG